MRLIIDAMSGDNAPEAIVRGAAMGAKQLDVEVTLVGDETRINKILEDGGFDKSKIKTVHSSSVIDMCDDPICVAKSKKDSSMGTGFTLLKEGQGDAFISAGNTGALLVGSTLILRRIKGIKRAAIGAIIPLERPSLLVDAGGNVEVSANDLLQFAAMGSIYMKNMYSIDNPKVGLINNGAEETKGTPVYREAYALLRDSDSINFCGNVEGRDVPFSPVDILVADGFTGNVTLKLIEGFGSFLSKTLKGLFTKNLLTKFAYLLTKKNIGALKKQLDHTEYGGAPLLGVSAPVIKAHGSSNEKAIISAMKQAVIFANSSIISEITEYASSLKKE